MRYFFLIFGFLVVLIVAVFGWRGHKFTQPPIEIFPDMDVQPKVKAQTASTFYADGRAARPPVAGTVPMGYAMPQNAEGEKSDSPYQNLVFSTGSSYENTGMMEDRWGTGMPEEITIDTMKRGQERYSIYCAICHGATGAGNGMANKFGMATVQSLTQERLRTMSDGEIFHTITYGKNTMMGYGDRIQVPDRWAIVAYVRALQKSQGGGTWNDVPPEEREKLKKP